MPSQIIKMFNHKKGSSEQVYQVKQIYLPVYVIKTNLCMYIEFFVYSDGANSDPRLIFNSNSFSNS